jgi:hypothetical protein
MKLQSAPVLCVLISLTLLSGFGLAQSDSLALSSGSAVAGGTATLNLSLVSPAGSEPAGIQWTLTFTPADVLSISASDGSALTAASKSLSCAGSSGSYTCLGTGLNLNTISNGVVAQVAVQVARSTSIGITNALGASVAAEAISVSATGGAVSVLAITPTSLPNGVWNTPYNQPLAATGGTMPYSWSVISGSLPAGLMLATDTGLISGAPTATGPASFTVQVTDANSLAATQAFTVTTAAAPTTTAVTSLPAAVTYSPAAQNVNVAASVAVTGGSPPASGGTVTFTLLAAGGSGQTVFKPRTLLAASRASAFLPVADRRTRRVPLALALSVSSAQGTVQADGTATAILTLPAALSVSGSPYTLQAVYSGNGVFAASPTATVTGYLTVNPAKPVITWTPLQATMSNGSPLSAAQLNATANVAGSFTYTDSSNGNALVGTGTVLVGGTHVLIAAFTPADTTDYAGNGTASATITVGQPLGPAKLIVSHGPLNSDGKGNWLVTVTIQNNGGSEADNVTLSSAKLGTVSANAFSGSLGTIAAGNQTQVQLTFAGASLTAGQVVALSMKTSSTTTSPLGASWSFLVQIP